MSEDPEDPPAVKLLTNLASIVKSIATNMQQNRLDRKEFQKLLRDYASRAESDGRLLFASRHNSRCVNHGLFLAHTHIELVSWLEKNNYNLVSTSVKWYSWKKLFPKYQLPFFSISSQTTQLRTMLRIIDERANSLYSNLQANNVAIEPTSIEYEKVLTPLPSGPPPEAFENLLRRGSLLKQQLSQQVDH